MKNVNDLLGLPWQLVEALLQAANIPYKIKLGANYNKFFNIVNTGAYVARITNVDDNEDTLEILLYYPMIDSGFGMSKEVEYAQIDFGIKK